ncbi:MAG: hypothetical protein KAS32_16355 [Candidatus Peribacteraceae bacterium]|nr:hypothetical protein [Candidatus Peribacteraceae bacterium]
MKNVYMEYDEESGWNVRLSEEQHPIEGNTKPEREFVENEIERHWRMKPGSYVLNVEEK